MVSNREMVSTARNQATLDYTHQQDLPVIGYTLHKCIT